MEVEIGRIGARGDGVAESADGRFYVPFTIPGERVRIRPGGARGNGRDADLLEILAPAIERRAPACPHFGHCGGCALQHLADAAYAEWKLERLELALARAGITSSPREPLVRTPPRARRRARFAAVRRSAGPHATLCVGFAVRRGHDVVDLAACPVLDPQILALLPALRQLLVTLPERRAPAHIAVPRLDAGLDVVVERTGAPTLAEREHLAAFSAAADLARLSWLAADLSQPAEPLVERRRPFAVFGGVLVALPPGGFLQASTAGEVALVAVVVGALANVGGSSRRRAVADLFAGAGTFTFPLAAAGARVHAIDADAASLQALKDAARPIPGVSVERRDLLARPLLSEELRQYDMVVFDPPRAGAAAQAAQLAAASVPTVVAVSCNPETFARDARILIDGGYRLERIVPVDQFLWSPHLELAAVFRR
ncbi:MAG: class I SAM-dependent RNA methyltransferase [Rhodospirillales bacterium]|nr:class I SAM-dependent RNA methyltransferase [Rhodospirillales bacterium]